MERKVTTELGTIQFLRKITELGTIRSKNTRELYIDIPKISKNRARRREMHRQGINRQEDKKCIDKE